MSRTVPRIVDNIYLSICNIGSENKMTWLRRWVSLFHDLWSNDTVNDPMIQSCYTAYNNNRYITKPNPKPNPNPNQTTTLTLSMVGSCIRYFWIINHWIMDHGIDIPIDWLLWKIWQKHFGVFLSVHSVYNSKCCTFFHSPPRSDLKIGDTAAEYVAARELSQNVPDELR